MAARSVTGVAVACLVFLALGTRPAAVAAQAQMSVDAEGEPVLVPGVAVTDPVDGTWVYGDEVSVTIRVTNFDVGTDGSVCVSASWLMDGEDADWSCYSNAPSGVLTTNVYGAKNATYGRHRIAAVLLSADGRAVSTPGAAHVYVDRQGVQVQLR